MLVISVDSSVACIVTGAAIDVVTLACVIGFCLMAVVPVALYVLSWLYVLYCGGVDIEVSQL